jgi:hypothetical protein
VKEEAAVAMVAAGQEEELQAAARAAVRAAARAAARAATPVEEAAAC